jgi:hypothetical protein
MMGPLLTTAAPEAAPGELFAGYAATLKSEQLPSDLRGFFRRWRHSGPPIFVSRQARCQPAALNARLLRGAALRRSSFCKLRERVQSCAGSEPLECHSAIKCSLLKRPRCVRPIHASASEGVEPSDRRRCEKFASWERVFMTYVIQLDVAHVLPLRLPTPRRFGLPLALTSLFRHGRKDDGEA